MSVPYSVLGPPMSEAERDWIRKGAVSMATRCRTNVRGDPIDVDAVLAAVNRQFAYQDERERQIQAVWADLREKP